MKQFTEEQAKKMAGGGIWKGWTDEEVVKFQLYQDRLCMDFSHFHKAVESVLKRPVWTHEFASIDTLRKEFEGGKPAPTLEEIMNLIPKEKRILVIK